MPPSTSQPMHGPLVQRGLEYRIRGVLDGVTPAIGREVVDQTQLVIVTIPDPLIPGAPNDAGLFDPVDSDGEAASRGDRFIDWLEIRPDMPIPAGAFVAVATTLLDEDGNDLIPAIGPLLNLELPTQQPVPGNAFFYTSEPIFVPQCAVVRIGGFTAVDNRVLFGVRSATTAWEEALYLGAWCCLQSGFMGGGDGDAVEVVNEFSFTTRQAVFGSDEADFFMEWSGTPANFGVEGFAATVQNSTTIETGADRIMLRPGRMSRFAIQFSSARTIEAFVEIDAVRTVVSAATVCGAGTIVVIPLTAFPEWNVGQLLRVGFTDLTETPETIDIRAEVELTLQT